jgi:hypothetical protein
MYNPQQQRGLVLVWLMVLTLVLSLLGVESLHSSVNTLRIAKQAQQQAQFMWLSQKLLSTAQMQLQQSNSLPCMYPTAEHWQFAVKLDKWWQRHATCRLHLQQVTARWLVEYLDSQPLTTLAKPADYFRITMQIQADRFGRSMILQTVVVRVQEGAALLLVHKGAWRRLA